MRRFRRTTLITVGCLAALAGLGLARKTDFYPTESWLLLLPLLILLKRKNVTSLIIVAFLGLSLGLWRGSVFMGNVAQLKSLTERTVSLEAAASSDAIYGNRGQLQFTANHIKLIKPYVKPLAGSFKISGFGEKMVYRGDIVQVQGKLFPTRGANQATIAYAQLKTLSLGHSWFADFSRKFSVGMQNALPEPLASFGMGLLVGQRINMPAVITAELTAVGLVHIVAVSGYNLTILVRGVQRLKLRSKYQQLIFSLLLIGLFVSVTGFSASIVRAALVSVLGLWAWYYGRKIKPAVLISFAAALTALANPFYIWGDLSWYLSFLAFFGVMVIAPIIQARFFKRTPKFVTVVLLETLSAELMTLPIIMLTFSQLSIISLLANLIVVPLVPVAMLLGAIAATAGALIPQLAGWFALPARIILTYMLDIVHVLASIPSVLVHASISPTLMLSFYAILLITILSMHRRSKLKAVKIEEVFIK